MPRATEKKTLKPPRAACQLPTAAWKQAFRRRLLSWFRQHARDLEWRRSRDPYRVWISEIMLQQTQVGTVTSYFSKFIAAFPTVEALAAAREQQVLRLWEGLGYYRRARQLHRAAAVIVREYGGRFPQDPEAVRRLPGIGRYTAGAILSIAFDAHEPIVEANTLRLLSRLLAYRGDPRTTAGQKLLWQFAEELLPRCGSGIFNQALMELGALVCTPREPACGGCPVRGLCPTHREGLQHVVPRAKSPPRIEQVREAAVVVRRRGRVLLVERQPGERWAGLWDFPRFPLDLADNGQQRQVLIESVAELTGVVCRPRELLTTLKHGVTRFRITLDCHAADYERVIFGKSARAKTAWVAPDELKQYPLSVTGRKLARLICD